jgi:alkanesulfonate monooxygenase SsuD/methylene tetrahydromethanopterin reductase-like flavin-dependent oxidoreductase (luciferase family)
VPPVDGHRTVQRWFGGDEAAIGTPERVIEHIKAYEAVGMEYAIVYFPDAAYGGESLEVFAREVIPAFA